MQLFLAGPHPMDKSWALMCLPIHKELKIVVHLRTQVSLEVTVTDVCLCFSDKGLYDNYFNESTFLLHHINTLEKTILWWMHKLQ